MIHFDSVLNLKIFFSSFYSLIDDIFGFSLRFSHRVFRDIAEFILKTVTMANFLEQIQNISNRLLNLKTTIEDLRRSIKESFLYLLITQKNIFKYKQETISTLALFLFWHCFLGVNLLSIYPAICEFISNNSMYMAKAITFLKDKYPAIRLLFSRSLLSPPINIYPFAIIFVLFCIHKKINQPSGAQNDSTLPLPLSNSIIDFISPLNSILHLVDLFIIFPLKKLSSALRGEDPYLSYCSSGKNIPFFEKFIPNIVIQGLLYSFLYSFFLQNRLFLINISSILLSSVIETIAMVPTILSILLMISMILVVNGARKIPELVIFSTTLCFTILQLRVFYQLLDSHLAAEFHPIAQEKSNPNLRALHNNSHAQKTAESEENQKIHLSFLEFFNSEYRYRDTIMDWNQPQKSLFFSNPAADVLKYIPLGTISQTPPNIKIKTLASVS